MFEIVANQESPETLRRRRCLIQDLVGGSAVVYLAGQNDVVFSGRPERIDQKLDMIAFYKS